jgi:hypothetical protein
LQALPERPFKKAHKTSQKGAQDLGKNITETGKAVDQTLNQDTSQLTQTATNLGNFTGNILQDPNTGLLPRMGLGVAGNSAYWCGPLDVW